MKVNIKEKNKLPISFTIPNSLLFSKLTKRIIMYSLKNNTTQAPNIDYIQIEMLLDGLKKYVNEYGHFDLVDVESSDGTIVKITV